MLNNVVLAIGRVLVLRIVVVNVDWGMNLVIVHVFSSVVIEVYPGLQVVVHGSVVVRILTEL